MEKIDFGSLRRLEPVSQEWGFDRGRPIDRYYIESFLADHSNSIKGHVLEIKDRSYTQQFGGDRVKQGSVLDIDPQNPEVTHIADLTISDRLDSNQFDCVIFTQTLQLISRPKIALETIYKVLKPQGSLLITCPGITRIEHNGKDGGWYWAFTPLSLGMLLEETFGCESFNVKCYGNVFAATCFLWGISVEEIKLPELDHHDPNYPVILTALATKRNLI